MRDAKRQRTEGDPFRGASGGCVVEFGEPDGAHQGGVGAGGEFRRLLGKRRAGLVNRDTAEQALGEAEGVIPLAGDVFEHADGLAGDFGPDAIAGEDENVELHELIRHRTERLFLGMLLLALFNQGDDFFVHEALLTVVGDGGEAVVEIVELGLGEFEAHLGGALMQGVAAAVFAEDEAAFGDADGARVDDFVGGLFFR